MTGLARRLALAVPTVVALVVLAGCSSDGTGDGAAAPGTSSPAVGCGLTVSDQWVKATDSEMTGVFGTIGNPGQAAVTVVSVSSPSAGKAEIHEVVTKGGASVMQPKAGGLQIPAGGSATLAPGADHLMLMHLTGPIQPGDDVEVTLVCPDGLTTKFVAVAKPFEGGAESYQPTMEMSASPTAG